MQHLGLNERTHSLSISATFDQCDISHKATACTFADPRRTLKGEQYFVCWCLYIVCANREAGIEQS